jgi:hypothetical protein
MMPSPRIVRLTLAALAVVVIVVVVMGMVVRAVAVTS